MNKALIIFGILMIFILAPSTIAKTCESECEGVEEINNAGDDCKNCLKSMSPEDKHETIQEIRNLAADVENEESSPNKQRDQQTEREDQESSSGTSSGSEKAGDVTYEVKSTKGGYTTTNTKKGEERISSYSTQVQLSTGGETSSLYVETKWDGRHNEYQVIEDPGEDSKYKVRGCGGGFFEDCNIQKKEGDKWKDADLSEEQRNNLKKVSNKASEAANEKKEKDREDGKKKHISKQRLQNKLLDDLSQKGAGKIKSILDSWTTKLFGKYLEGFPAYACGDSIYEKEEEQGETESEGMLDSLMAPETEYKSQMEKDILEDTRTTMLAGEKAEIDKDLYRYAITMRLIGGPDGGKWTVYLYNSCTDKSSLKDFKESDGKHGWMDHGRISKQQYVGTHYAGGQSASGMGGSMIFNCEEENCRFNKACVKYDDGYKKCTTLANGPGFTTEGETGSLEC